MRVDQIEPPFRVSSFRAQNASGHGTQLPGQVGLLEPFEWARGDVVNAKPRSDGLNRGNFA